MASDNTLIFRAQAGDEQAFADLMRAYHPFVYAIVMEIVNNPQDAEEVVQDTFVNAYRGLTQYQEMAKFKNWLAEIARNRARSWLRKQRIDTIPIEEVSKPTPGTQDLPDDQLIRDEQRELIRRALGTLSEKDREIARAYYLDGASYDELIRTHRLSYKAISVRLSRAKQKLAKRLQHLLTGIFVSPAMTLKKIYSGGLTVMKVGTVPKITVGVAALVALIFIGVRQMNAPTVEERVYLSPWEAGTAPTPNKTERLVAQTDTTPDTEIRDNQPQISAEEMEPIEDFFAQLDEANAQSAEAEFQQDADAGDATDTSATPADTTQSAEDVMNAYVEALRNLDLEAMPPLMTGALKEKFEKIISMGFDTAPIEITPDEIVEAIEATGEDLDVRTKEEISRFVQQMPELMRETIRATSQTEVVNSEYVGDEFHFRLRMPTPEIPGMEINIETPRFKMRKVDGAWRIYDGPPDGPAN